MVVEVEREEVVVIVEVVRSYVNNLIMYFNLNASGLYIGYC